MFSITLNGYLVNLVSLAKKHWGAKALTKQLEEEMRLAAENLEFEKAIALRDKILELRKAVG